MLPKRIIKCAECAFVVHLEEGIIPTEEYNELAKHFKDKHPKEYNKIQKFIWESGEKSGISERGRRRF